MDHFTLTGMQFAGPGEEFTKAEAQQMEPRSEATNRRQGIENAGTLRGVAPRPFVGNSANGKLLNMQGGFLIRHSRLTALGILLCVLAALFAVEAKIAWFSPAGSATAQISFDKASPVEPTKAPPQRFNSPAPPTFDFAMMATLVDATVLLGISATFLVWRALARPASSCFPGFSSPLFFRPPPIL